MKTNPRIAIVGATGLVGTEMRQIIEEMKLPFSELRLLASGQSKGELYSIAGDEYEVDELNENSFAGIDLALFATSPEISAKFVPIAVKAGATCIDNSRYYRMHEDVPLVVPEVNFKKISSANKIIANPNCSTIQLVPVLDVINRLSALKRVVVSTYQSVSGAGRDALDELWAQNLAIFNQKDVPQDVFQHQIAFNVIPQIDVIMDSGYTREEEKIINESRKILDLPNLRITATAVRVPVMYSHAESVFVECDGPISVRDCIAALESAPGIEVYADYTDYPMPLQVAGTDTIHVGRIRRDSSVEHGLSLWIVADNVRKGAALNALQIAKALIDPTLEQGYSVSGASTTELV